MLDPFLEQTSRIRQTTLTPATFRYFSKKALYPFQQTVTFNNSPASTQLNP
jgi:hypothetical protein